MLTDGLALIDQHCHGVVTTDLDRPEFESLLTEADKDWSSAGPLLAGSSHAPRDLLVGSSRGPRDLLAGSSHTPRDLLAASSHTPRDLLAGSSRQRSRFDSLLGAAVRRWCAPVLGLPDHVQPDSYLERRAELGWREVSRRLLRAAGTVTWAVDTGIGGMSLTSVAELAELGGAAAYEVIRLEAVAERVARSGVGAAEFPAAVEAELRALAGGVAPLAGRAAPLAGSVVAFKSVAAYRCGLALPAESPSWAEVVRAAGAWLRRGAGRLTDPVVLGWLVHLGIALGRELGLPLQLHTGFGDADVRLHQADPLLLTDFLAATAASGATVVLLHCWPYHRNAGYLAHVFGHVLVDVGLAIPYVGERAGAVLAELLELAPFGAVCFSSDGVGLPELHYLGAVLWRRGLGRLLDHWIAEGVLPVADAERLASGMAWANCARAYPALNQAGS